MGKIADAVMRMFAEGKRSAYIVTEIAKMEAKGEKAEISATLLDEEFAHFWAEWPHKTGKPDALRAYGKARQRGGTLDEIMVGMQRYVQTRRPDQPWLNPTTFLNQERFRDQPAIVAPALKGRAAARQSLREEIENEHRDQSSDPRHAGRLQLHPGDR